MYTNGDTWHVKRRVRQEWVSIIDLPLDIDRKSSQPIMELLRAMDALNPLLYSLGERLCGKDSRYFLSAMQKFFHGSNLFTEDIDDDLRFATDNLLRCLWAVGDDHYQDGKFRAAQSGFEKYRQAANVGFEIAPGGDSLWVEMNYLLAGLMQIVEGTKGIAVGDLLVLRIAAALADYGRLLYQVKDSNAYPPIEQSVQQSLRDYIEYILAVRLNTSLPDPLGRGWNAEVRSYCSTAWTAHVEGEQRD